jgi:hypothetical protein
MTDELTDKRPDRLIIDDPHADPVPSTRGFVRDAIERAMPAARDAMKREVDRARGWDLASGPDRACIALVVSDGSPRAGQIGRLLAAHGLGDRLVLMPTPDPAQLADLFEPMHVRIAKAFTVPTDLLFESPPCVSHALIERRARRLSAQIDEALLSGRGFPTAAEAMRQFAGAAERFGAALREVGWRWPVQVDRPRLSKRHRRRLRGRAKALRRWQRAA